MGTDVLVGIWQAGSLLGLHDGHDLLFAAPGHFQYGTHAQRRVGRNPRGDLVLLGVFFRRARDRSDNCASRMLRTTPVKRS